jgi:hypothetical protein
VKPSELDLVATDEIKALLAKAAKDPDPEWRAFAEGLAAASCEETSTPRSPRCHWRNGR